MSLEPDHDEVERVWKKKQIRGNGSDFFTQVEIQATAKRNSNL